MAAVADLVCWPWLEGRRRCVPHADLAAARGVDAVVVPIPANTHSSEQAAAVQAHAAAIQQRLSGDGMSARLDASRKLTPAAKAHHWERCGVPLRLELGASEAAAGSVTIALNPGLAAHRCLLSTSSGCASLLRQYGGAAGGWEAAAAASSSAGPAAAAVPVFGARPVKLRGVPAAEAGNVCRQLLDAAATADGSSLLPHGCCHRLHLWPDAAPPPPGWAAAVSTAAAAAPTRPCAQHLQHLLGLSKPCHCGAAPHVDLAALKAEVARHVQLAGGSSQRLASALERLGDCSSSDSGAVSLLLSGLPVQWPVTLARPAIAAAVRAALHSSSSTAGGTAVAVSVAGGGTRSSSCCRGWAKVTLPDLAAATAVMEQLRGHLEVTLPQGSDSHADAPGDSSSSGEAASRRRAATVAVSWCSGRADALFPSLPYCCRRALRLDAVAAFSTTDEATGRSIAALLRDLALLCGAGQDDQAPLSALDLTACAGGATAALLDCFGAVTAVELDPDRAEHLLHNVTVFLGAHHEHTQPEEEQCSSTRRAWRQQVGLRQPCGLAFDPQLVPHLAVLCAQGEQQQQQQGACRSVAVVCGDAVRLLPHVQQQSVVFVDPPWGGPRYMQQQQASGSGVAAAAAAGVDDDDDDDDGTGPGPGVTASRCAAGHMGLGDMPLLQLCCAAAGRCSVLAVRLPSRCADLRDLARGLLAALAEGDGKERVARCAAVVRLGRSSLLCLAQGRGQLGGQDDLAAAVKARLQGLPAWTCRVMGNQWSCVP